MRKDPTKSGLHAEHRHSCALIKRSISGVKFSLNSWMDASKNFGALGALVGLRVSCSDMPSSSVPGGSPSVPSSSYAALRLGLIKAVQSSSLSGSLSTFLSAFK